MPGERTATLMVAAVGVIAIVYILYLVVMVPLISQGAVKPTLGEGQPVAPEHVEWLVKELGAGALHPAQGSAKKPEIEMVVNPGSQYFTVTVDKGVPNTRKGMADDPDIRLTGDRTVIVELLSAPDLLPAARRLKDEGSVQLEMLRSQEELSAMGYGALYARLTS